jgi:aspartate-semialdehyde dehydrogenase
MTDRIPSAVLGASGYIGQVFVRLIAEHPYFEPTVLAAGDRSVGRRLEEVWRLAEDIPEGLAGVRLVEAKPRALASQVDIAFGGMPSGVAGPIETDLARRGVAVFSNAADHRLDRDHPLLVPEVNPAHLELLRRRPKGTAPIVTNPNCSATGLALALAPVFPVLAPKVVHVATYQSLSGAGYPGVPALAIADNVIPFIDSEEEKLAREAPMLLGQVKAGRLVPSQVPFLPHCARVATRESHLEAVTIEAGARPTLREIQQAWTSFDPLAGLDLPTAPHPPVELRTEADRPQPVRDRWAGRGRARGMAASVGRVRWTPPYLRFFLLSHNAVRGGAGGSVLNAELALAQGYLPREPRRRRPAGR